MAKKKTTKKVATTITDEKPVEPVTSAEEEVLAEPADTAETAPASTTDVAPLVSDHISLRRAIQGMK